MILGVSAVIVTRGNVDLKPVLQSLPFEEIVVWNNATRSEDLGVYGRYAAIRETTNPFIYVQDDDCILEPASIRALADACLCWHHGYPAVFANMPEPFRAHYSDSCLVGFGAIFRRDVPDAAFGRIFPPKPRLHDPMLPRSIDFSPEGDWANYRFGRAGVTGHIESAAAFRRTCDVFFTTLTPRVLLDVPYRNLDYAYGDDRMYRQPEHVGERARMLELARQVRDA